MAIEMPPLGVERHLTIEQASALFEVHPATIRRWIANGQLPAYRVGRLVRIKPSDLEALGRRIPSAGDA